MERVQSFLSELLRSQRFGGRVVARDEKTLIVFDTPSWGERESRAVRAKFPECDVEVHAFDGSLSGFIVIITRSREPLAYLSESAFLLVLIGFCYSLYWLHGSLQVAWVA
jgi:hypothetical protein